MAGLIGLVGFFAIYIFGFVLPNYLLWYWFSGRKAKTIRAGFKEVGNLSGKTIAQIRAIGGEPLSLVAQGDEQFGTWGGKGYYIVLVFKNGVCETVSRADIN